MIVIGLGTGRCGTLSLANLINNQPGGLCFHEAGAANAKWGWPGSSLPLVAELQKVIDGGPRDQVPFDWPRRCTEADKLRTVREIHTIGDVAFYHLPNVPRLIEAFSGIRFPVLKRDRQETIASYTRKVATTRPRRWPLPMERTHRNHWIDHDGSIWVRDPHWDPCHPKFKAIDLPDAIGQYWDMYYETARQFETNYPEQVRTFHMATLNTSEGRQSILEFCGLPLEIDTTVHMNGTPTR